MNNRDWERFGEDIRRTIQDAVEYGNYDRLNQTISNTVNQATDWVNRNVNSARKTGPTTYQAEDYSYQTPPKQSLKLYKVSSTSMVASILFIVFGFTLGSIILLSFAGLLIASFFTGDLLAGLVGLAIGVGVSAIFFGMGAKGISGIGRINRFKKYVKEIGNAEFCNISDLADAVRKPIKYVVKDIEKMIHKGWFLQGHLDKQKTCLITTNQMYQQYKQLEVRKETQKAEAEMAQQREDESRKTLTPEVQKVIEQGDYYIKKLQECNDAIPGEEISAKISKIEMVVAKIFARVKQNPSSVADIRKLMEYYLPTTVKLLEAYAEMDAQPVVGTNIQTAKQEIEATLDTLNVAFEKLLDSLFQDAAWDVSSDISVLHTMLAQEGLKDDGLKK